MADTPFTREQGIITPCGVSPEFVVDVLKAWRAGATVCPLEAGQETPEIQKLPEHCVHLKLTSATSGKSRVVAFTAPQLIADADNIVSTMKLRPDWINLGVISLAHSYGFSNLVLPLLLHGIPLALLNTTLPEAFRRAVELLGAVTVPAVPALWRAWHDAAALSPGIRLAISAGAPLPLSLEGDVFKRHGLKIHNFYGASECGGIAYDRTEVPRRDASCVGSLLDGVSVSLDEEGRLIVEGAAVGESYWPMPDDSLAHRCFRTSDLAEIRTGEIHLLGRASDMINVAGRKVSPDSIESALLRHASVRDCIVFGVAASEAERSETIVACVVTMAPVSSETLRQFMLQHLQPWQVPREWEFVESLDVNARGKRSRSSWKEWFLHSRVRR
jgi:acyl-CoA synthetase (AMP-forming)/AMP-acid ligase II